MHVAHRNMWSVGPDPSSWVGHATDEDAHSMSPNVLYPLSDSIPSRIANEFLII